MSVAVYTAIAGDYPIKRTDIKCFAGEGIFQRSVMEAKRYKILSHLFFPNDVTIWIDGNIWLRLSPQETADRLLGDADIALFRHPYRRTPWQEFAALKEQHRFQIPYLQRQLTAQKEFYREDGLPADVQLYECNVMVRRNNERVRLLMESWWAQVCRWQWRDQVSLPYVLWKSDAKVNANDGNVREHELFDYVSQY